MLVLKLLNTCEPQKPAQYWYILVYIGIYWYILVLVYIGIGIYWYILVLVYIGIYILVYIGSVLAFPIFWYILGVC